MFVYERLINIELCATENEAAETGAGINAISEPEYDMSSSVRLSVCRLSVTFVHPIQYRVSWPCIDTQVKFYGDRPRGREEG